jgi:hypothetical protein
VSSESQRWRQNEHPKAQLQNGLRLNVCFSIVTKCGRGQSSIAEKVASEASLILTQAYERKPCFFSGKSEKGILSGLFYHLSQKYKSTKTQHSMHGA